MRLILKGLQQSNASRRRSNFVDPLEELATDHWMSDQ